MAIQDLVNDRSLQDRGSDFAQRLGAGQTKRPVNTATAADSLARRMNKESARDHRALEKEFDKQQKDRR